VNAYHAHLDRCAQCRAHPWGLCPVGAAALNEAAADALRDMTLDVPTAEKKGAKHGDEAG